MTCEQSNCDETPTVVTPEGYLCADCAKDLAASMIEELERDARDTETEQ